jgi:hypothetical protein
MAMFKRLSEVALCGSYLTQIQMCESDALRIADGLLQIQTLGVEIVCVFVRFLRICQCAEIPYSMGNAVDIAMSALNGQVFFKIGARKGVLPLRSCDTAEIAQGDSDILGDA